ncbi:ADP-ribosylation factor-like protein 13B [Aricia agestis]|uniref:ADP-ribosylation factor-like protein 13B n=1 Tax=Aricia agestis TaxID=91739 RepID=UPI001C2019F2|nr:ADP-ribosylation factor-like protein 13B [Aricia agestis]
MGMCFGRFRRRRIRRHIVLILIGLDNAGKTKTVNNLAGENDDKVLPTVGFKAVNLIHKDTPVTIYDLGGGPHFRQIWPQYYSEVHGVIFVIDSSDYTRLEECKTVLEEVLSHDKISGKPVLVLANKQDKNGALDDLDVVEKLNIEPMVNRYRCPTLVEPYSASTDTKSKKIKIDPGLRKGYEWLLNYIIRRYGDINLRVQTDIYSELERRKRLMRPPGKLTPPVEIENDISTQTGFENPNFEKYDNTVIIVKPVKPTSNNSTITIESSEEAIKPKLSPLFGRASNSTTETVKIELEPRNEFRKLSPIVRKGVNHIDFKHRPQSSPTFNRNNISKPSKSSTTGSVMDTSLTDRNVSMGDRNRTWDPSYLHKPESDHKLERVSTTKSASSDTWRSAPRPASASDTVRRQLQAGHKRRLSLRYTQRHKTSPENSLFLYEPGKTYGKGDCTQASVN